MPFAVFSLLFHAVWQKRLRLVCLKIQSFKVFNTFRLDGCLSLQVLIMYTELKCLIRKI